jgi:osmotically-inducible protein OsmY
LTRLTFWVGLLSLMCLLPPAPLMGEADQDDVIYDQVRIRLAGDPDVNGGALEVEVKDGVVTVRGKVRTEKGRAKVEKLAKKVKGVKQVINEVRVDSLI